MFCEYGLIVSKRLAFSLLFDVYISENGVCCKTALVFEKNTVQLLMLSYTENMSSVLMDNNAKPKSMSRAKQWTGEVENLYRFQQAGYRDELEYRQIKQVEVPIVVM